MSRGYTLVAVLQRLIAVASSVVEHHLKVLSFSSCGTTAWLFRGTWDLPGPEIELMTPALASGFLTTGPLGKSRPCLSIQPPVDHASSSKKLFLSGNY